MSLECVKTGAQAYLAETGQYVYGDAFVRGDLLFLHVAGVDYRPINFPRRHFVVNFVVHWFDELQTSQRYNTVLIASDWTYDGYEGVTIEMPIPDDLQESA